MGESESSTPDATLATDRRHHRCILVQAGDTGKRGSAHATTPAPEALSDPRPALAAHRTRSLLPRSTRPPLLRFPLCLVAWLCVSLASSGVFGALLEFPPDGQPQNASWPGRSKGCTIVNDDTLILIGGYGGNILGRLNDVYHLHDASGDWTDNVASSDRFTPRFGHACAVYGDTSRIWLLAGQDGDVRNDVWSSGDLGATWTAHNAAPWEGRQYPALYVTTDGTGSTLWMAGGTSTGTDFELWKTNDPSTPAKWERVSFTGTVAPPKRIGFGFGALSATSQGTLWVAGGYSGKFTLQDLYSFDIPTGTWTQHESYPGVNNIFGGAAVHAGRLYLVGGRTQRLDPTITEDPPDMPLPEDVVSWDGSSWMREPSAPLFPISWPQVASFRNTLMVLGGDAGLNDVFNSVFVSSDQYLTPAPPSGGGGGGGGGAGGGAGGGGGTTTGAAGGGVGGGGAGGAGGGAGGTGPAAGGSTDPGASGGVAGTSGAGGAGSDPASTATPGPGAGVPDPTDGNGSGQAVGGGGTTPGTPTVITAPGADTSHTPSWVLPVVLSLVALMLLCCLILGLLFWRRRQRNQALAKNNPDAPLATHADVESGWLAARAKAAAALAKRKQAHPERYAGGDHVMPAAAAGVAAAGAAAAYAASRRPSPSQSDAAAAPPASAAAPPMSPEPRSLPASSVAPGAASGSDALPAAGAASAAPFTLPPGFSHIGPDSGVTGSSVPSAPLAGTQELRGGSGAGRGTLLPPITHTPGKYGTFQSHPPGFAPSWAAQYAATSTAAGAAVAAGAGPSAPIAGTREFRTGELVTPHTATPGKYATFDSRPPAYAPAATAATATAAAVPASPLVPFDRNVVQPLASPLQQEYEYRYTTGATPAATPGAPISYTYSVQDSP